MMATGRLLHRIPSSLMVAGAGAGLVTVLVPVNTAGLAATDFAGGILTSRRFLHVSCRQLRCLAVFHPIEDFIEAVALFRFDEQLNLAAGIMIFQNPLFFHLFILRIHQQITDQFAKTFLGIVTQSRSPLLWHIFVHPGMGIFVSTGFLHLGQRQSGQHAQLVARPFPDRHGAEATQQVGAFKGVAFCIEHGIHVNAINDRDIHICRERRETGEQSVEGILDLGTDLFDIVGFQYHRFGVTGAKPATVRQLNAVVLDRQTADGTRGQL